MRSQKLENLLNLAWDATGTIIFFSEVAVGIVEPELSC